MGTPLPGSGFDSRTPDSEFVEAFGGIDPFDTSEDPFDTPGDIEEILRQSNFGGETPWASDLVFRDCPTNYPVDFHAPFYRQPELPSNSPDLLMMRFDKQTCGILSVKDGPNENPWRTLMWPLARDSPAIYHAIASMTAFHAAKGEPVLHYDGIGHFKTSLKLLRQNISSMRPDTALATTLVLAFSESWDRHISTGSQHLRAARHILNHALADHGERSLVGHDLARLKFLCNAFLYMDVIARLTSADADECNDFEYLISPIPAPFGCLASSEIDPLMGCASSLFPLIGRAANLCRRARQSESNSIAIVSQATELKRQIEQWETTGTSFERPEDPSSEVEDALQTAEAYRYATLLYLHQAVPEIPSKLTSAQLAHKVLVRLATVPASSRLVIVQIYPLLAAGCEATIQEDRRTVKERWQNMAARMRIGNIDRCYEVMLEVWRRRDAFEAWKKAKRSRSSQAVLTPPQRRSDVCKEMSEAFSFQDMLNGCHLGGSDKETQYQPGLSSSPAGAHRRKNSEPIIEDMDVEYTVRGRLHWAGVMKEWGWEVLLG